MERIFFSNEVQCVQRVPGAVADPARQRELSHGYQALFRPAPQADKRKEEL